jgi:polyphosphate kinase
MGALRFYFQDNVKARRLRSDGSYARAPRQGAEPFQAQVRLREEAFRRKERSQKRSGMLFEPRLFPSEQG